MRGADPIPGADEFLRAASARVTAHGAAPNDVLALATLRLREKDPQAVDLFERIANRHNVREAWLGAAVANHMQGNVERARSSLEMALSGHAHLSIPPVVADIVRSTEAHGWAAITSRGEVTVCLLKRRPNLSGVTVTLDGTPIALQQKTGNNLSAEMPPDWLLGSEIRVTVKGASILGSTIRLNEIASVEGFADSVNGDIHGWAWHPNNPERCPVLTVAPASGGPGITVTATEHVSFPTHGAMVRARGFQVEANRLRKFDGPVSVRGENGRPLTGSPLDPSAERRSAATASRLVADLFPAPGREPVAVQVMVALSTPAYIIGKAAAASRRRRDVEAVIPVYGAIDCVLACIASATATLPSWARIHVVDDASPDPRLRRALQRLATRGRITLDRNAVNSGFPMTANRGMRHDPARDVVLLNSDTLVPPGWLESLRELAYSAPSIGTVTPMSNDATIVSYPSNEHDNPIPSLDEITALNALCHEANPGGLEDIPTAVGFCVYIKRDCLNATGLLREDMFAQGYGEENDFCIRARHLGWRHVAATGVFVGHIGGRSFGSSRDHLIERNMRRVNQLHPGYDKLIAEFTSADPLAAARRRIDTARWKTFRTAAPSALLVTHGRGGGVQRHVAERAAALRAEGIRPIVLWPVASINGDGRDCVLGNGPEGGTPNLRFSIPAELGLLVDLLREDRPVRAEVHHLMGHDPRILELFALLHIPYSVVVHDYSWVCPRINLVGRGSRYCGEPDVETCDACVADLGTTNDEQISVADLRARSEHVIRDAARVTVPSQDVAVRMRRYFPNVVSEVTPWEDNLTVPPRRPSSMPGFQRVCVIGAIGIEKGYDMLLACARDAVRRGLPMEFILVGHSCDDARLAAIGNVRITGRYDDAHAVDLVRSQEASIAWIPSIWPETWCYTLSTAWKAGLNVVVYDIGTQAERVRRTGLGWVYPLGISAAALNDKMLFACTTQPLQTVK